MLMQAGLQSFEVEAATDDHTHPVLITSSDSVAFVRADHHLAVRSDKGQHVPTRSKLDKQNDYRFYIALFLTFAYFFVEIFVGIYYGYLSLVADAMHMLSDVIAMLIGLYAMRLSRKHASEQSTFGWTRCEVVGGLINSTFVLAVCLTIMVDAISSIIKNDFNTTVDDSNVVLWIAVGGLVLNCLGFVILGSARQSSTDESGEKSTTSALENKNMQGVLLHVAADGLSSVAVLASVLFIKLSTFEWRYLVDPVLSIFIVFLLAVATIPLMREAMAILLQQTPREMDVKKVVYRLLAWDDVIGIHNFHVWTLANNKVIASMHATLTEDADVPHVLNRFTAILKEFGVSSATIHPLVMKSEKRIDGCKQAA